MDPCAMKAGEVAFPIRAEDHCAGIGEHCHWQFPDRKLCFWHYHHLTLLLHVADGVGEQSRSDHSHQNGFRARAKGLLVMGTPIDSE